MDSGSDGDVIGEQKPGWGGAENCMEDGWGEELMPGETGDKQTVWEDRLTRREIRPGGKTGNVRTAKGIWDRDQNRKKPRGLRISARQDAQRLDRG